MASLKCCHFLLPKEVNRTCWVVTIHDHRGDRVTTGPPLKAAVPLPLGKMALFGTPLQKIMVREKKYHRNYPKRSKNTFPADPLNNPQEIVLFGTPLRKLLGCTP